MGSRVCLYTRAFGRRRAGRCGTSLSGPLPRVEWRARRGARTVDLCLHEVRGQGRGCWPPHRLLACPKPGRHKTNSQGPAPASACSSLGRPKFLPRKKKNREDGRAQAVYPVLRHRTSSLLHRSAARAGRIFALRAAGCRARALWAGPTDAGAQRREKIIAARRSSAPTQASTKLNDATR